MTRSVIRAGGLAIMLGVATLVTTAGVGQANRPLPQQYEGGTAADFKGKTFDLPVGGEKTVVVSVEAGKEVVVTTSGDQAALTHLHLRSLYYEVKDATPGPDCLIKFTPVKGDDKVVLCVKNAGTTASKVTLAVKAGK